MSVARKWHFSTSGGAANLKGVYGDLFEHRVSGIPLLEITSLNRHFYAQIDWAIRVFHKYCRQAFSHQHSCFGIKTIMVFHLWDISLLIYKTFIPSIRKKY